MSLSSSVKKTAVAWSIWAVATCYGCFPPTNVTAPKTPKPPVAPYRVDTAIYSPAVLNNFQFLYDMIQAKPDGTEFALCLNGKVATNGTPVVLYSIMPYIERAYRDSVWAHCPKTYPYYLGRAHSHPPGSLCKYSETDSTSFVRDTAAIMGAVICENRQMITYVKNKRTRVDRP